jgi:S1-C subfamily serine protease
MDGQDREDTQRPDVTARQDGRQAPVPETSDPAGEAQVPNAWRRRSVRIGAYVAAAAISTGAGFGIAGLVHGSSNDAASAIPSPPAQNQKFVEDDDGTGADSQENVLDSTVPGMVHILSAGNASTGVGMMLTPSGKVLTASQNLPSHGQVRVGILLSGQTYPARVVGTDPADDLALLQVEGGSDFKTVAVGNARGLAVGDAVISVGSKGDTRSYTYNIGNLAAVNGSAVVAGHRLTGLLQTTAQVVAGQESGGPLVNLSGQVVGVNAIGTRHGVDVTAFAIPVNTALAVAGRIDKRG